MISLALNIGLILAVLFLLWQYVHVLDLWSKAKEELACYQRLHQAEVERNGELLRVNYELARANEDLYQALDRRCPRTPLLHMLIYKN